MKREEVIEEARVAFTEAWEAEDERQLNLGIINDPDHPRSRAGIIAALDVFEKAHTTTPPDGWFYMGSHVGAPWLNLEFSEEMDETGIPLWERPVQHTPTDDEREALTLMASDSSVETWVCGKCGGDAYEHSLTTSTCIWEPIETRPAPQGEPSDAQVNRDYLAQVIHKAVYSRIPLDDLTDEAQADTYKRADAVVAALRAAGVS